MLGAPPHASILIVGAEPRSERRRSLTTMKLTTNLFVLVSAYASLSAAQTTTADSDIFTIQPVTSIIPSSLVSVPPPLTTSRSLGGSQIEPSSFTTS